MTMTNGQIADTLELLADLMEFDGANSFRVRAYRNGVRAVRDLPQQLSEWVNHPGNKLVDIEDIGKSVAEKVSTLLQGGRIKQLEELRAKIPESVLGMLRIPGLGPKRAAILFHELNIQTLADLKDACNAGQVRTLKGFGARTEKAILDGMAIAETAGDRMYWAQADQIASAVRAHMSECSEVEQLALAGSYRRGKETVGDLDVLARSASADVVMDHFGRFDSAADVLGRGPTKMSLRLRSGMQVDLRVVPAESFGAALQYFTGSKEHNVILRGMAKDRGLKINEYGVYRVEGDHNHYLAGATEEDVYRSLDLPLIPPELREGRGEFALAQQGRLPQLIELQDLRGDLHMHTTETDGRGTLREMVQAARQRGLQYLAITDHSQRVSMARGLDPVRLRKQWREIDELNQELGDEFHVLKGIECDILEQGGMDLPDDVLAEADWVLASIHYGQNQPREKIMARILEALEHPSVSAIAHPTGRLINRREAYQVDVDQVIAAAKRHGKMLELNANPARLDLNDVNCAAAKELGVPIVISSDAHNVEGLDVLRYGVLQARRGGLTNRDVANTATWSEFRQLLRH